MIVQTMTPVDVYREIDKDMHEVVRWWMGKRKMLTDIAKWTVKLPWKRWFEYESSRRNRFIVQSIIMGIVVGILLHVSVNILFDHDHNNFTVAKLLLIILAFVAAYFTPGCPEIYPFQIA